MNALIKKPRLYQIAIFLGATVLVGCNAAKTVHNAGFADMREIYDAVTGGSQQGGSATDAIRSEARQRTPSYAEPPVEIDVVPYTRTVQNETDFQFTRLPNPTIFLYMDPHLIGVEGIPVPGYTTAFTLYESDHWALPHEAPAFISRTRATRESGL